MLHFSFQSPFLFFCHHVYLCCLFIHVLFFCPTYVHVCQNETVTASIWGFFSSCAAACRICRCLQSVGWTLTSVCVSFSWVIQFSVSEHIEYLVKDDRSLRICIKTEAGNACLDRWFKGNTSMQNISCYSKDYADSIPEIQNETSATCCAPDLQGSKKRNLTEDIFLCGSYWIPAVWGNHLWCTKLSHRPRYWFVSESQVCGWDLCVSLTTAVFQSVSKACCSAMAKLCMYCKIQVAL